MKGDCEELLAVRDALLDTQTSGIYFGIYHGLGPIMSQIAKLFTNGRSQAVRLPAAFRFDAKEVFIRQDEATGDVILSRKPSDWKEFMVALEGLEIPSEFLSDRESDASLPVRDPLAGICE